MRLITALTALSIASIECINAEDASFLSMIGDINMQHSPTFGNDIEIIKKLTKNEETTAHRRLRGGSRKPPKSAKGSRKSRKSAKGSRKAGKSAKSECNPAKIELSDYEQWRAEEGYWIGEYTFLQGDGTPYVSGKWPYPYQSYKGFITGEISGNAYRQRNVFLYPKLDSAVCNDYVTNNATISVVGDGTCGINGNTKVFEADQIATTCSDGGIEGPYQGLSTYTQLVGSDNALLYQVFFPSALLNKYGVPATEDRLYQSQLTTITENPSTGQMYRTRTAQGFNVITGETSFASYYPVISTWS
ncbi:hypothetical protein FRACYDRAFT_259284 [Fragilariopsis cylindrus CCMP1102]|uniref:Uncharacterized protein n=1 Tax=Fragilariopsis cylindrus CCMP1102 TaxID=635003 RepID=A0A1E7FY25_9STRA|nr:hypothetical protein FRACYDRAFT_259284 [Fragilariopsis cylindrus CCMP1102]|eukprot:OEU23034.1 hypothetical protein FRACYDRAFT_259284 [Fragilariopsis cylindrus CCMP1102]